MHRVFYWNVSWKCIWLGNLDTERGEVKCWRCVFCWCRKRPSVSWAQSRNSLLLTIDVKDARETGDMFVTTDTSVSFRLADTLRPFCISRVLYRGTNVRLWLTNIQVLPTFQCTAIQMHICGQQGQPQLQFLTRVRGRLKVVESSCRAMLLLWAWCLSVRPSVVLVDCDHNMQRGYSQQEFCRLTTMLCNQPVDVDCQVGL